MDSHEGILIPPPCLQAADLFYRKTSDSFFSAPREESRTSKLLSRNLPSLLNWCNNVQASLVALVAALCGIIMDKFLGTTPVFRIIGDALIMGAFIIAITAFLLFLKKRFLGSSDEIMWTSSH